MRNKFPGHYKPSMADFKKLWTECLFVPDANILLHLFRYGEKTRAQVFDTLKRLMPRVWIPYRVGFEFQRRWREVDQSNRDAYDKLSREIESEGRKLGALFNEYTRHQTIDVKVEQQVIDDFIKGVCARLSASKDKHPSRESAEKIFSDISDLIGDSVGDCPTREQMDFLIKEGQKRYDESVPPGYRDAKTKEGSDKYGDFFIWKEVLEKAKADKKPTIIITDDVKEDWWQEFRGQKIGPRPELVEEMKSYAGQSFYLYTLSQFLDYAGTFLNRKPDIDAIKEIKSDELQRREIARHPLLETSEPLIDPRLERFLRREQHLLRRHLTDIDSRIDSIESDPEQISLIPDLIDERRMVLDNLKNINRNIHDLRYRARRSASTNDDRIYSQIPRNIRQHLNAKSEEGVGYKFFKSSSSEEPEDS